ncbi:MAG: bifunctional alpha,alpha-trehalose-phosphate synthase (UDP-forming)/trehalose-phosphatase [Myxococcota bacterium]
MMSRLLIVSNRLPVTVRVESGRLNVRPSAGGLATGLRGPHREHQGKWLGWPGMAARLSSSQRAELDGRLAEMGAVALYLTPGEVDRFYEEFANGVLWPLFHYLLDRVPLDQGGWDTYQKVNARFADLVAQHYQPGDRIWIHDYQLALVPGLVRQRIPDARIGFFLHIPFPAHEVFRILPWRQEILRGLLGADVVGLHTRAYVRHFRDSVAELLGGAASGPLMHEGRRVAVGAFPISVDTAAFAAASTSDEVLTGAAGIRAANPGQLLVLGVDRLDYTKGIPRRLLAFERLLEREPSLRGRVRLLQVAVPSRTRVPAYEGFRRVVEELVGRINGAYGTPGWAPIHYMFRSFPEREVTALYRAADVMVVTPLRDGLNLVAKEFVATRTDERGVLILSELAGSAAELKEALHVNPYDVEGTAQAMRDALQMAPEEQSRRMRSLRAHVTEYDVHRWARDFLRALAEPDSAAS